MNKPYSKEEYKKLKEQEYNELQQKLDAGIKDALNSDKYKDFLKTMSKFYNYSAYNSILIGLQNENATFVASAKNWAKQNVKINEEEKGNPIKIICGYDRQVNIYETDDKGKNILDENNKPKVKEVRTYINFRPGYIYDIVQTSAKDDDRFRLKKESDVIIKNKDKIIKGLEKITGIKIEFANNLGRANGTYNREDNTIRVRGNMGDVKTISTSIHESAHALLHKNKKIEKSHEQIEFEAESVAFVVCERLGIDSKENNFLYLANWVGKEDISEFKNSISDIQRVSNKILRELTKYQEQDLMQHQNQEQEM